MKIWRCLKQKLWRSHLCVLAFLFTSNAESSAQGTVGSVIGFANICGDRNGFIYGVDKQNPYLVVRSFNHSDFVGRFPLSGSAYSAELWYAPGGNAEVTSLQPFVGSVTHFFDGANRGLFKGAPKLEVLGTLGGDLYTLQIRFWDNRAGTIRSWEQVLADDTIPRATSRLITGYELSGLDTKGMLHGRSVACTTGGLESLGLYVVPEPRQLGMAIVAVGFSLSLLCKKN